MRLNSIFATRQLPAPPLVAPAHFPPAFQSIWYEIVTQLGDLATPARAVKIEAASMLLAELRLTTPDAWPPDRYRTLAGIMRALRTKEKT